jgi:hypothetical protein
MDEESPRGPVEMVTVPALGAEWGKDELQGMTKRARREEKSDRFKVKWRAFNRGQYGIFGNKWLTRRTVVFVIFATCIAYVPFFSSRVLRTPHVFWSCEPLSLVSIGITLAFVIPRVPGFAINGSSPLVSATGWFNSSIPAEFSRSPANFSFAGAISLQVDTGGNFLPLVFNHLDAQVYDLDSLRQVGVGHLNHTKLPAKTFTDIMMPLNFTYLATNDSDLTCQLKLLFIFLLSADQVADIR